MTKKNLINNNQAKAVTVAPPEFKLFSSILDELEKKHSLTKLCTQLKWLIVRACQKDDPALIGSFSATKTLFREKFRRGEYVVTRYITFPARIANYLQILDQGTEEAKSRLLKLFRALCADNKMLHHNLRDRFWDSIQGSLDNPLPEDSNLLVRGLNSLLKFSIECPHDLTIQAKNALVGSRDEIDKILHMVYEILTATGAKELRKALKQFDSQFQNGVMFVTEMWSPRLARLERIREINQHL